MKIFGFIPARAGSKEILWKNIRPFNGKPLIAYTIEAARRSKINRLIVSTDSRKISDIAKDYGAEVPFLRPRALARDNSCIEDALWDSLKRLKEEENYTPDIIVLLQPTSPLRTFRHINDSIKLLIKERVDTVVSVSHPMEHPGDMVYWKFKEKMRFLLEGNRESKALQRQDFPPCLFINGAVYAFTYKNFIRTHNRLGKKILPYLMRQVHSIDIDSMDDFILAESVCRLSSKLRRKFK